MRILFLLGVLVLSRTQASAARSLTTKIEEQTVPASRGSLKFETEPGLLVTATDSIRVSFEFEDAAGTIDLGLTRNIYHPSASILKPQGDGFVPLEIPSGVSTFTSGPSDAVGGSMTVTQSGAFTGTILLNGQVHLFKSVGGEAGIRRLQSEKGDGAYVVDVDVNKVGDMKESGTRLRSLQLNSRLTPWTDCYPGDEQFHFLDIGVATDLSYFEKFGTREAALANIEDFISSANIVYASQLHIYLRLQQVVLVEPDSTFPPDDEFQFFRQTISGSQGQICENRAEDLLEKFKVWVGRIPGNGNIATQAVQHATWELFTACYEFGTVGSAFVASLDGQGRGTLCEAGINCGVSSMTTRGFVTFAHEVGHNLGSGHSFENGEGSTGGIMDNGNGFFEGQIQFRDERRPEICEGLTRATKFCSAKFTPFDSVCATQTTCGTGICENGVCLQMRYVFNISNSLVDHQIASEEVATFLNIPTFLDTEYVVLSTFERNNRFACDPLEDVVATNAAKFLVIEDISDSSDPIANCSYLDRARNIKERGFSGAIIFNREQEVIVNMTQTSSEISNQEPPVENFFFVYIESVIGGVISSREFRVQAGWELIDSQKPFSTLASLEVQDVEEPSKIPFLIILMATVGLVVAGLIMTLFTKSHNPTIVAARQSFADKIHLPSHGSKGMEDMDEEVALHLQHLQGPVQVSDFIKKSPTKEQTTEI